MTKEYREYAKSRIEYLLKVDDFLVKHDREALEMAIQALSQEPTEICCATCKHERLDDRNYKCEFQNECLVEGKRGKYEFAYAKYEPIVEQEPCTDNVSEKEQKPCKYCDEDGFCLTQNLCISQRTICNKYYAEQEPCDDTVSIRKDVLKCRVGELVAYNVEWLKKHWQMEMDIVCGVKPCGDAISRKDAEQMFRNIRCHLKPQDYKSAEEFNTRDLMLLNAEQMIHALPSVTQKSGKWDRLYSWLNDMRLGIAPDETVDDIDERHCRESQTHILDEIMEWMIKAESEDKGE